ncbi:MAG: helix-turn-helix transcriptional regulator [Flavobacteriales bacterium]|nr:helix-turn-helix transcriptional regulator [Flavobacteriales bacterium]
MLLTIRNMVCDRCKSAVWRVLTAQGLSVRQVDLGEVEVEGQPSLAELHRVNDALRTEGFELVDDRDAALIARVKAVIVKLVHHSGDADGRVKLAEHLSDALHKDYSTLSALFSQVEGITIEHYFLLQRLERVKEMVRYGELTLSEIADRTGFSSVAHLSNQFKKLTGMTPTAFKQIGNRKELDKVG